MVESRVGFSFRDEAERRRAIESAQLDFLTDNLKTARGQVLLWGAVVLAVCSGPFPEIATGIGSGVASWALLMAGVGLMFHLVLQIWPHGSAVVRFGLSRSAAYAGSYAVLGAAWGLLPWAILTPGHLANEAAVAIGLIAVFAVLSARVAPHPRSFLAASVTLSVIGVPAYLLQHTAISPALFLCAPVWLGLMTASSLRFSSRVAAMIDMQWQNEHLAAECASARDEAQAASHAKSAFLANMSHELRTPLNAIIGFSDVMQSELLGGLDPRYRDYAADINASGAHLLALLDDVLDIAKIEAGRMTIAPESIDVVEITAQLRRLIAPRADEKNQTLSIDIARAPEEIVADIRATRQIVLNLASNAMKFTQQGGRIEIGIRRDGSDIVLWVEDDGPGIAPDHMTRLFNPFERVDNGYMASGGGTGLGLAMVRALARLHGGDAGIESRLGFGTRVTVRLPSAVAETAYAAAA